jgi:hypothetical protein
MASFRVLPVVAALLVACGGDADPDSTEDAGGDGANDTAGPDASSPDVADSAGGDTGPDVIDPPAELVDIALIGGTADAALGVTRAGSTLELRPVLHADGTTSLPTACVLNDAGLECTFAAGTFVAAVGGGVVASTFEATADTAFEGLELVGTWEGATPTSFLSNGFQSWSQTGFVALAAPASDEQLDDAVGARGDVEVMRDGRGISWFYTVLAGDPAGVLVAGVTGPGPLRPWIAPSVIEGVPAVRLVQGASGESMTLAPGDEVVLAPWSIQLAADAHRGLESYASRCSYRDGLDAVELGWNSWYELWNTVDAAAVLANAERARELLGDGSGEGIRIVIDDGWQQAWGDWEPNEKFPEGIDGLVDSLKAEGHDVGIWFAPLIASTSSEVFAAHPEWFVEGVSWNHVLEGEMRILDVTNAEAAAHLTQVVDNMRGWGLTLLKIDFLFAGTFEGGRAEALTGMQAYDRAMRVLRDAAGDDIALLAVGAPPVATFPYAEAWRVGPDIAVSTFGPAWPFVAGEARTIAGRYMFCAHTACDGDPALLRVLEQNEVEVGQWVAALSGGAFFLSDDLRSLDAERDAWLNADAVALGVGGVPAVPVDLVPTTPPATLANALSDQLGGRNRHVVPGTWRLPSGETLYVNWSNAPATIAARELGARSALVVP